VIQEFLQIGERRRSGSYAAYKKQVRGKNIVTLEIRSDKGNYPAPVCQ
jgi:hypothetical protein